MTRRSYFNANKKTTSQTTQTSQVSSLENIIGADNMDLALKSALAVWDNFVGKYPDKMLSKNFLIRNIALVRRLVEAVVPNVMKNVIELEDKYVSVADAYEVQAHKYMSDMLALSGMIPVTMSCISTVGELDLVAFRLSKYGIIIDAYGPDFLDPQGQHGVESTSTEVDEDSVEFGEDGTPLMASPLWLMCVILPNESLSPHLLTHDMYTKMTANKNIKVVDLKSCALMEESEAVSDLLDSLDNEA